eukprot:2694661-Rhodomonas_salina.1
MRAGQCGRDACALWGAGCGSAMGRHRTAPLGLLPVAERPPCEAHEEGGGGRKEDGERERWRDGGEGEREGGQF